MKFGSLNATPHRGRLVKEAVIRAKDRPVSPSNSAPSLPVSTRVESRFPTIGRAPRNPDGEGPRGLVKHRGALLKGLLLKPKDSADMIDLEARHMPKDKLLPHVELEGPSFYNRYGTAAAISAAIDNVPTVENAEEMIAQLTAYLETRMANIDPTKPTLILMPERHDSRLAKMAQLSVLQHFQGRGGCQLMVENVPEVFNGVVASYRNGSEDNRIQQMQDLYARAAASDASLDASEESAVQDRGNMFTVQFHVADQMNVGVVPFDVNRMTARNEDEREAGMIRSIGSQANRPGQVSVVSLGEHHSAKIEEAFKKKANVITIYSVKGHPLDDEMPRHLLRRKSYLLSHPNALRLRSPAIEEDSTSFFRHAQGLLAAHVQPPAGPALGASSGSDESLFHTPVQSMSEVEGELLPELDDVLPNPQPVAAEPPPGPVLDAGEFGIERATTPPVRTEDRSPSPSRSRRSSPAPILYTPGPLGGLRSSGSSRSRSSASALREAGPASAPVQDAGLRSGENSPVSRRSWSSSVRAADVRTRNSSQATFVTAEEPAPENVPVPVSPVLDAERSSVLSGRTETEEGAVTEFEAEQQALTRKNANRFDRLGDDVIRYLVAAGEVSGPDLKALTETDHRMRQVFLPEFQVKVAGALRRVPDDEKNELVEHVIMEMLPQLHLMDRHPVLAELAKHYHSIPPQSRDPMLTEALWGMSLNHPLAHRADILKNVEVSWFPPEEREERFEEFLASCAPLYEQGLVASTHDQLMDEPQYEYRDQDPMFTGVGRKYATNLTPLWRAKSEVAHLPAGAQRAAYARIVEMEGGDTAAIQAFLPRLEVPGDPGHPVGVQNNVHYAYDLVANGFSNVEAAYVAGLVDEGEINRLSSRTPIRLAMWRGQNEVHSLSGFIAHQATGIPRHPIRRT